MGVCERHFILTGFFLKEKNGDLGFYRTDEANKCKYPVHAVNATRLQSAESKDVFDTAYSSADCVVLQAIGH